MPLRGYLTGSIDAVLRVGSPARYLVVDYKTNRLGGYDEPLTAWHYRSAALETAMIEAHYPLQALLYAVALHRYLRWRQPGYDPDVHLGGCLYLFLRGMSGPGVARRRRCGAGVFSWRPPTGLVVGLLGPAGGSRVTRPGSSRRWRLRAAGAAAPTSTGPGILSAADVHVALRLGRIGGETDEAVLLAAALVVRSTRHGSVVLDLATAEATTSPDVDEDGASAPWSRSGRPGLAGRLGRRGARASPLVGGAAADRRARGCGWRGTGSRRSRSRPSCWTRSATAPDDLDAAPCSRPAWRGCSPAAGDADQRDGRRGRARCRG